MSDFADYLKTARESSGLNQVELASKVGLTGSYISILENRKKPPPSDPVLKRLALALGVAEAKMLEVAHLDRSPTDIRKKIRALDRRLLLERKLTKRLLTDVLPSSLWHFWRVRGYHEYGLEKVRLDTRKKRILRKILRRIGHLTSRDDFEKESRLVIEGLPLSERSVLAEVLPELTQLPGKEETAAPAPRAYFVEAADDDMLPRIEQGDLLLVEPAEDVRPGDLVLLEGKRPIVRQVAEGGKRLLLVATNPKVPPRAGRREELAGVVVEIRRRLR